MGKIENQPIRQVYIIGANTPPPDTLLKMGVGEYVSGIRRSAPGVITDIAVVTETDYTGITSHTVLMKSPRVHGLTPGSPLDQIFNAEMNKPENVESYLLEHDALPSAGKLFDFGPRASARVSDGD